MVDGAAMYQSACWVIYFATPNLNRIPCVTEDEFVDADVNHEIGHLSQEYRLYRQWRRQTDNKKNEF